MPFRYRLQKMLDFRIRKKEEQQIVVQKAKDEVVKVEQKIEKNRKDIIGTRTSMRMAEAIMMEIYDRFLKHLYEIDAKLVEEKEKAVENLNKELEKLQELEKAVKVLEKHKEKSKEAYIEEEKKEELKKLSEVAVQKHFIKNREKLEEEEAEELEKLKDRKNGNKN